ncbi:hypothetical protein EDC04DRAFT_2723771 [Pisolithus marmoratus]|nr:hypothetical protein EDC04DRAFT_2727651 [Pisolithus marmoratus]KAI6024464.1 hypothetical protein EDC04DRAFT_2723771 [Pisolithus marmoratus]
MSNEPYVSPEVVKESYRPRSYRMSPGLLRAREPFRVKNAITGLILAGLGVGVWAYSIRAVKQEDFSDVDEEAREMIRGRATENVGVSSSTDVAAAITPTKSHAASAAAAELVHCPAPSSRGIEPAARQADQRGILAPVIDRAFPRLLDPTRKTLVWGAPPVDNMGRLSMQNSLEERR